MPQTIQHPDKIVKEFVYNSETNSLRPAGSLTAYSFEKVVTWQASVPNSPIRKVCAGAAFLSLVVLGAIEAVVRGILYLPVAPFAYCILPERIAAARPKDVSLMKCVACTIGGGIYSAIFAAKSFTNFARICQNKPLKNSNSILN